jgi:cytochrome c biogenesis protein CcmG/thiol:disulfide interchange protein DsbE
MHAPPAPATRSGSLALRPLAVALAVLALALTLFGSYGERWGVGAAGASGVGVPAPEIQAQTLAGGRVMLAQYRGRVVVLNFWATWCPPCRQELPDLQAYGAQMGERVAILGVNQQEPPHVVAPFVRASALTYPILLDDGQIGAAYRVSSLPTTVLVDRDGVVRERVIGALAMDVLESKVKRLLG